MAKTTLYQKGAAFERRVKEHFESELKKLSRDYRSLKYYLVRAAGSRGKLDLVMCLTDTESGQQRIIGIQCKITRPSYDAMDKFISEVKHEIGIDTYYAFKKGRDIEVYPWPMDLQGRYSA